MATMLGRCIHVVLGLCLISSTAVFAATDPAADTPDKSSKPLWEVGAGVAVAGYPDFPGSDQYNFVGVPIPVVVYRGDRLRVSRGDARAQLYDSSRLDINVTGGGSLPADSDRDNGRDGMPDLDPTFSVGPSFDWTLSDPSNHKSRLRLRLPIRTAFVASVSDFDTLGVLVQPNIVYDRYWQQGADAWTLSVQAGPLWASSSYNTYYYAVKPEFARANRPAYSASSGYGGTRASVGLLRRRGRLSFGSYLSLDYLKGATFDDSPLVVTDQSYLAGAFVAWHFWQSETRAPRPERSDAPYE